MWALLALQWSLRVSVEGVDRVVSTRGITTVRDTYLHGAPPARRALPGKRNPYVTVIRIPRGFNRSSPTLTHT
jgi:hypothetical protein